MMQKEIKSRSIRSLAVIIFIGAVGGFLMSLTHFLGLLRLSLSPSPFTLTAGAAISIFSGFIAWGLWHFKNWARSVIYTIALVIILFFLLTAVFDFSSIIFAGKEITSFNVMYQTFISVFMIQFIRKAAFPFGIIILLKFQKESFTENQAQRKLIDKISRPLLFLSATSSILIVGLIFLFTLSESTQAIKQIGLEELLTGTIWRPGAIIGSQTGQFGLIPMVLGSIYSTIGAMLLGVPLSLGTAILLAEIAPPFIRNIIRPAIELLAGIPSVIYGLIGIILIAPLIRKIEIPGNSGFGLLNASVILAVMILPTMTSIAEDAIRAVPDAYRQASLAVGATRWQTIKNVVLPAARSGLIAAVVLGIGRALGETMALIMVIGNSIAIPAPLNRNPLTIVLSAARTLTGNIAVEINYAEGIHRSALFFTGVLLFILLLVINRAAHFIMKARKIT